MDFITSVHVDYNKPITREQIDLDKYKAKFVRVDKWLASDRQDDFEYGQLMLDPTTFAYLHQRVDGQPLKYYPYQDMIANDPHRFKFFRAANQIGKSLHLDSKAARNLIWDHGHGHNEAIVSKSLPQSTYQMRRVKSLLRTMPEIQWADVKGQTDSLSVISVDIKDEKGNTKYTNYLICAPSTEGLLGYDLHELNLDEFEFWENDQAYFFNQIAQPRTYTTKGNITIYTNPNGADNFGAELEAQVTLKGEKKWHVYVFNYLDKPGNTQEEYDQLKHELSRQVFESTVDAVRSISDRNFFKPDEIIDSEDLDLNELSMVGKYPYFFLDVGYVNDQCCLTGGFIEVKEGYDDNKGIEYNQAYIELNIPIIHLYPKQYPISRVIGSYDAKQDNDGWHYEKSVKEHLDEWRIGDQRTQPEFGFDVTGNKGMIPLFEAEGINYRDITFSGPEKSALWVRFKYFMEKRLIKRIKHKEWRSQAGKVIATKSARGYLLINSKGINTKKGEGGSKKEPDDCLDATAGLIAIADPKSFIKESLAIIKRER